MKEPKRRILALLIGLIGGFLGNTWFIVGLLYGVVFCLVLSAFLLEIFYSKSPVKMRDYVNWFYAMAGFFGGSALWVLVTAMQPQK